MKRKKQNEYSFWHRNGLSVTFAGLLLLALVGQIITGRGEFNQEMQEYGQPAIGMATYLSSGHFISATFENWESEFLQMGLYVILTVFLRQKGSSESNPMKAVPARRITKNSPAPVRCGGWQRKIYENSLSLAFLMMFLVSYVLHVWGSWEHFNLE